MTRPEEYRPPRNAEELFDPEGQQPDDVSALIERPNAADTKTLRRKAVSDKAQEFTDEADLRELLALPSGAGVRFLARLLGHCNWNAEHFHPSNSVMSYAAGRRSICRDLENWVSDADVRLWLEVRLELEKQRPKPKTSEKRGGSRS